MSNFNEQYNWQRCFIPQVTQILKFNASKFFDISEATFEQDTQHATDLVLRINGGDIALRLRKDTCRFRDFTIRCCNSSHNHCTEIDKIRKGFARWYFYGWVNPNGIIKEWILIDINIFRSSGLSAIDKEPIPNGDGTAFYPYTLDELFQHRCLLAHELEVSA